MKVIAIYSGKGGVGKSTTSALIALAMADRFDKVSLLDFDINTPSAPVLFGGRSEVNNLKIHSTGYRCGGLMGFTGTAQKKVLNSLVKQVEVYDPDVCIIDMPPGTSSVHLSVCGKISPSSFILISQPNSLCESDAMRATELFAKIEAPILGVIYNMVGDFFGTDPSGKIGLNVLKSVNSDMILQINQMPELSMKSLTTHIPA